MPTIALVVLLAAGAGLALLIRSIVSLETAIDRDNEVPAKDYPDRGRAQEAIQVLEANGIPSMIRHGGYRGGIYSVVVRPEQADKAREILSAEEAQSEPSP